MIDSTKKDIPLSVLGTLEDEEEGEEEGEEWMGEASLEEELGMARGVLKLAEKLQLHKFDFKSMIFMLKMLWNVVANKYCLPTTPHLGLHADILHAWSRCMCKLLDSPHESLMRKHMKELGMATALDILIDASPQFELDSHLELLRLIGCYIRPDQSETDDLVEGIVVLGNDIESKTRYVVYCLYLVQKQWQPLYLSALNILDEMFSQYGYLADHVDKRLFEHILSLVVHPVR